MVIKNHVLFALASGVVASKVFLGSGVSILTLLPALLFLIFLSDIDFRRRIVPNHMRYIGALCIASAGLYYSLVVLSADVLDVLMLPALVLGSALTDIDHTKSYVGSRVRFLSVPISMLIGHRRFFHTLACVFLIYLILTFFVGDTPLVWALAFGYLTHIAADILTGGIPLFWPVSNKSVRFPILGFSLIAEKIFVYVYLVFSLLFFFR